jgi:MFS family permease
MGAADINPRVTLYLYLVIIFCYLFCHIDLGILAVSNDAIIKKLEITEGDMGLLATALYIGNVAGSLLCPVLFAKLKAKHVLVVSAVMNAGAVCVFTFVNNYWIIFASRLVTGLFQVPFIIYFPVWIDQQAPPKSQSMWISFFFLTVPIGLIVGYVSTNFLMAGNPTSDIFKWSFLLQTALMIFPIAVLFLCFPAKYFEKITEGKGGNGEENRITQPLFEQLSHLKNSISQSNEHLSHSIDEIKKAAQ